jgi:hypothetical protein
VLSGNWHVLAVASILSTLRFIANMGSLGLLLHYRRVSILLDWRWLVTTALSLGLTVDILITLSMCYFLQKMRSSESKRCVWRPSGTIMVANGWIGRVPWLRRYFSGASASHFQFCRKCKAHDSLESTILTRYELGFHSSSTGID